MIQWMNKKSKEYCECWQKEAQEENWERVKEAHEQDDASAE